MARTETPSNILTIRVPRDLERRLAREARRRRLTRSAMARVILEDGLGDVAVADPRAEARRQSLLASGRRSEREAIRFVTAAADLKGWK